MTDSLSNKVAEIMSRPFRPLTLDYFSVEQQALIKKIWTGDNKGWGTDPTALTSAEQDVFLELFQDGIVDYITDPDGSDWYVLTDRGTRLADGEALRSAEGDYDCDYRSEDHR